MQGIGEIQSEKRVEEREVVTQVVLQYPVVAEDVFTCEQNSIAIWLKTISKSPLTKDVIYLCVMIPNLTLKSAEKKKQRKDINNSEGKNDEEQVMV